MTEERTKMIAQYERNREYFERWLAVGMPYAPLPELGLCFTPEQVKNLEEFQRSGVMHPFTCANRGEPGHFDNGVDHGVLVPTVRGWICQCCDYKQNWAHDFMLDGSAVKNHPFQRVVRSTTQPSAELIRLAVSALREAEAILGGEYGDTYAVLCETMFKLESALSARGALP